MGAPLVSVLTVTYNHERFIAPCIESVLAQSYGNWEMVIIDDGSTDKTLEIAQSFADARIRLFTQENLGLGRLAYTYNRALRIARGELCAILEGDDTWPPWKLERQVSAFAEQDVVLAWGRGVYISETGAPIGSTPSAIMRWSHEALRNQPLGRAVEPLVMGAFYLVPACSIMIRREALLDIGGFAQPEGMYCVDRPTALRLAFKGCFVYLDEVLGYWRIHREQASQGPAHEASLTCGEWFFSNLSCADKERYGLAGLEAKFRGFNHWQRARKALVRGCKASALKHCVGALLAPSTPHAARAKALAGLALVPMPNHLVRILLGRPTPLTERLRSLFTLRNRGMR